MTALDAPHAAETASPEHARLLRRATTLAIIVAGSLAVLKLSAWLLTGSVSVASSLVDSLLDIGASAVNLWAIRLALRPADREHRFGHGKAEPLAGLAQSAFVVGSAIFLSLEAVNRLLNPAPVTRGAIGIGVMVIAIIATLALVTYQRKVSRLTSSVAVEADSLHYTGDVLMNLAVIAGIVLSSELGWTWADPVFALGIATILIVSAVRILIRSIDQLMDRELPDETRAEIIALAESDPAVTEVHDLKTRMSGRQRFVQLHLTMDAMMPLVRAHAVGERVAAAIEALLPEAEVIVHHDPGGPDGEPLAEPQPD
ncbi:MAG: cation diffusion facilitator family transporter [Deltaproteobacteria bacterium]|nr:MAG: cation diffusion facilitator family transporter [Deltaproteobacteria bacterium]